MDARGEDGYGSTDYESTELKRGAEGFAMSGQCARNMRNAAGDQWLMTKGKNFNQGDIA